MRAAERIGTLRGKPVYRVPVLVRQPCGDFEWAEVTTSVISHSPADAANFVRNEYATEPQTEVVAYGAKGGKTTRWVGYESAIWAGLCNLDRTQGSLPFEVVR